MAPGIMTQTIEFVMKQYTSKKEDIVYIHTQ